MTFLVLPFLLCVVLSLMHAYFGIFVLKRGVLFLDLALAQWAALGYIVGHVLGLESPAVLFLVAYLFTLLASLILMVLRPLYEAINMQEAVIGVIYIFATALATAVISSAGLEAFHLKEMLAGHLLFVSKEDVISALCIYVGILGVLKGVHGVLLRPCVRGGSFIFYALFGLLVTSSVKLVGLLLVFSYLVMPVLIVMGANQTFQKKWMSACGIGICGSAAGLGLSLYSDISPSLCIILVFCILWLALSFLKRWRVSM